MTESTEPRRPYFQSGQSLATADELAQPRKRIMLPVSFDRWDRLKKRITALGNPRLDLVDYVVGAGGICIPCALSFLVYLGSDDRPAWALPSYGTVALASGAVALLLRHFQLSENQLRTEDAADIVAEMASIEEAYLRGETTV